MLVRELHVETDRKKTWLNLPRTNRRLPSGEKGSLKYFTALSDGVVARLSISVTQKPPKLIIFIR